MAIQNNSVVQSIGEKILYIEPNNINGGTGVPVPLENLCVYAELKVEYGSLHTESYSQDGQYFVLRLSINENGESNVSLYNGIQIDNSNDTFLSTEGYGNYTINTLNNAQTEELFGVESMEISYNSYAVPEVNIKFVDIKGAALHGAEELAHDKDGNLKDGNYESSSKFLSCFFAVPYPRFELYLKGFYGKPVYYDLTCASIKSAFNSQTGNYNVDVKLVGYSFSLISDINMCSLISAPYSTYFGESYWKEQIKNGRFLVDGNKMPTLQEIVNKWYSRTNWSINKNEDSVDFNDKLDTNGALHVIDKIKLFLSESYGSFFVVTSDNMVYLTLAGYKVIYEGATVNENKNKVNITLLNNNFDIFNDELNSHVNGTMSVLNFTSEFEIVNENDISLTTDDTQKISLDSIKVNGKYYRNKLLHDINDTLTKLVNNERKQLNDSKQNWQYRVSDEIIKEFGFKPTLYNLSKICFAHLETFLYMFERVRYNSPDNFMNFPKVYTENIDRNGVKTYEEDWLGSREDNNWREEVSFVNGIVNGLLNVKSQDKLTSDPIDGIVWPMPYDILNNIGESYQHPFINGFKNGFDYQVFIERYLSYLSYNIGNYKALYLTKLDFLKKAGELDANIYYTYNNKKNSQFIKDILSNKIQLSKYFNVAKGISTQDVYFGPILDPIRNKINLLNSENSDILTVQESNSWDTPSFKFDRFINQKTAYIVPKSKDSVTVFRNIKHNYYCSGDTFTYGFRYVENNKLTLVNRVDNLGGREKIAYEFGNASYEVQICNNKMNTNTHTLITIPYLKNDGELDESMSFYSNIFDTRFSERDFKYVCQRAGMFLLTFRYGPDTSMMGQVNLVLEILKLEKEKCEEIITLLPFYLYMTICSAFYFRLLGIKDSSEKHIIGGEFSGGLKYDFKWYGIKELLDELVSHERQIELARRFKEWVRVTFTTWDNEFYKTENALSNGVKYVPSDYYAPLYYATLCNSEKNGEKPKNDAHCVRFLNENNVVVQEMTMHLFKNVWFTTFGDYSHNGKTTTEIEFNPYSAEFENYVEGFSNKINVLFSGETNNYLSKYRKKEVSVNEYIKLNLYRYLKQIWDRWVVSKKNSYDTWRMEDVIDGVNKRVHFIDPSYNNIGDIVSCNLEKFIELIQTCKEQDDMPFLSFLSYFYGDNNCSLHNVQNFINSQSQENIENLFRAIPLSNINWDELKKFSDLIVLFSYQPAESMEDSFDINDENSLPSHMKVSKSEYHIPSFGVTYGMQNQNYFTDIDVSMNTPNVTDQSIQATFQIADENSKVGGSDSVSNIRSVGQDMYKVYSNHAYQCTVSMMGCAWIQPLMYFQLLNVPLFRGAYIIHKVTHSISPNNMKTTFVGTKVSKLSMRKLETSYYYAQREIVHEEMDLYETQKVKLTNNCDYAYYSPFGIDDKSNSKYISRLLTHFDSLYLSGITYGEYYSIILRQTSDFYVNSKEKLIGYMMWYLHNQWIVDRNDISDSENNSSHLNWFKNKFNINGGIFKVDEINDDMLTYYQDNKGLINDTLKNLKNCFSDPIAFVQNDYFGSDCNFIDGIIKDNEGNKDNVSYVIEINTLYFTKSNESFFKVDYNSNSSELSIEGLIKSFNDTLDHTDSLKGIKLSSEKIVGNIVLLKTNSNIDKIVKGQVYDMILQTYSQHLSTLVWVVKNKDSGYSMWDNLLIKIADGTQFTTKVGFIKNQNTLEVETIPTHESLHIDFYTSLIKKYRIQKDVSHKYASVNDNFNVECTNFNKLLSNNNEWHKKLLDYFNNDENIKQIKIVDCEDYFNDIVSPFDGSSETSSDGQYVKTKIEPTDHQLYTFEGAGQTGSTELAMKNENQLWDNEKTTITDNVSLLLARNGYTPVQKAKAVGEYAKTHVNPNDEGKCAKYVRLALEGAIKMNTSGHPEAASRYYNFLYYWGYSQIHYGFPSEFKGTYQDGDIIVISAIKNGEGTEVYGHIQVYYDGSWYAYKKYNTAQCYEKERLCYILRAPSSTPIISDNSGQIGGNLSVKTDTYEPSGHIIDFIKNKETFAAKSYWDVKQYSVGYGFQVNKELRSFFDIDNSVKDSEIIIKDEDKDKADDYLVHIIKNYAKTFIDCMGDYYKFYEQDELDALFDIYYNCGPGVFCKSGSPKMHAALKSGNKKEVMAQMDQGINQARGLRVRREQNRLWFDGKKGEVMQSLGIS